MKSTFAHPVIDTDIRNDYYTNRRKRTEPMRKILVLLSLFAFVSLSSFAHANHIKAPTIPVVTPDNPDIMSVSKKALPLSCGTLVEKMIHDTAKIELWVINTWAGAAHPFIIMRMYRVNEEVKFDSWLDRN
ncbi:MAG: hypothetical protein AAB727_02980, partial [Patescibacteria group bacterium]